MRKQFILSLLFLLAAGSLLSQPTQTWLQRFNGNAAGVDSAKCIGLDGSGNVYVGGTISNGANGLDYCVVKYNSAGTQQWASSYNNGGADWLNAMVVDNSGNTYITGGSQVGTNNLYGFCTIKINPSGVQLWVQRFELSLGNAGEARDIKTDAAGNVYVAGYLSLGGALTIIKYNSSGVQQWIVNSGTVGNLKVSLAVNPLGYVYAAGTGAGFAGIYYYTVAYNSSGVQQWNVSYNGGSSLSLNYLSGIAVDDVTNDIYILGTSTPYLGNQNIVTVKYNSSGIQQWASSYNGPANGKDTARAITLDALGNVIVTGGATTGSTFLDYCTIKYNPAGTQQWASIYDGSGFADLASNIVAGPYNYIYITGMSVGSTLTADFATIKYNPSGVQQWAVRYNGPASGLSAVDFALGLAVDASGGTYVTGGSAGTSTGLDFCSVKYSAPVGITNQNSEVPVEYCLGQNYPNPFNPVTTIQFSLPVDDYITLKIFDAAGRLVETLADKMENAGVHKYNFDAADYTSGIYFYKLSTERFSSTKKMLLIK